MLAEALLQDRRDDVTPSLSSPELACRPSEVVPRRRAASRLEDGAVDDAILVLRAKRGDHRAFEALVVRHRASALAVARAIVRNEQDALEVVQEAFLKVHRSLDQFSEQSTFFTWLYRIVSNVGIDWTRRPSRRLAHLDEATRVQLACSLHSAAAATDPEREAISMELRARIASEIESLPAYHRGVIVMRELRGLSYEQMALEMGVSKGTIMSRLFHARRKLQQALATEL